MWCLSSSFRPRCFFERGQGNTTQNSQSGGQPGLCIPDTKHSQPTGGPGLCLAGEGTQKFLSRGKGCRYEPMESHLDETGKAAESDRSLSRKTARYIPLPHTFPPFFVWIQVRDCFHTNTSPPGKAKAPAMFCNRVATIA